VIQRIKPDSVMVELDEKRARKLMESDANTPDSFIHKITEIFKQPANTTFIQVILTSFYRLLKLLGFDVGAEMKAAITTGKNIGAKIVLGDQDARITMTRLSNALNSEVGGNFIQKLFTGNMAIPGLDEAIKELGTINNLQEYAEKNEKSRYC